jgi:hypothetical protein
MRARGGRAGGPDGFARPHSDPPGLPAAFTPRKAVAAAGRRSTPAGVIGVRRGGGCGPAAGGEGAGPDRARPG